MPPSSTESTSFPKYFGLIVPKITTAERAHSFRRFLGATVPINDKTLQIGSTFHTYRTKSKKTSQTNSRTYGKWSEEPTEKDLLAVSIVVGARVLKPNRSRVLR